MTTRNACLALDAEDSLAPLRAQFALPAGVIYLDGNSLGARPVAALERAQAVIAQEWGDGLIRSWNSAGWRDLPQRLGNRLASLIGAGDVLNVDVSAELGGYFADTGGTVVVPPGTAQKTRLCHATRMALAAAMKNARAGQPINGIGAAIERTAKAYGFKVIENLGSHGVGRALHEAPEHIAGYFDPADKRLLTEGMVITIEPFLSTKTRIVTELDDGWTLAGAPGNLSAQYEHTMIITKGEPIVVTLQ